VRDPSFCVVLNNADYYAVYDGTSWSTPQHIAGNNGGFVSVSCPEVGWCMAVSTSGQAFEYPDGTWQAGVQ
jgi:hypothetical protein